MVITLICANLLSGTNNSVFQYEVQNEKEAFEKFDIDNEDGRYEILDVICEDNYEFR